MKKLQILLIAYLFLAFRLISFQATAQCGTFEDSPQGEDGLIAHQLYRDEVKSKNLEGAYENWQKAYSIAPAANGKNYLHYSDGRKILKVLFEKATDEAKKKELANQIVKLYDEQIQCYGKNGQEAYLLGRKGYNMFYYYRNYIGADTKEADAAVFETLKATVAKAANGIEDIILVTYASVVVNQFAAEKIDKAGARAIYDELNAIADHNIANNAKTGERFKAAKESMNSTFATIENHIFDCAYFVEKTRPTYEANPDDAKNLEECIRILKRRGCESTEPLLAELEGKYAKYASEENARRKAEWQANNPVAMAGKLKKEGDYAGAIAKYEEAISQTTDPAEQAKYYFGIAQIEYKPNGNYSKAASLARKAAEMKPGWGNPYLLIGDIYAKRSKGCKDDWQTRLAILAAIAKYQKAKSVDASIAEAATKRIRTYSGSKPEKSEGFMRKVTEGQVVKCSCVGESVKVSFK